MNTHFAELIHDLFFAHKPYVPVDFTAGLIVKNLCRDSPDAESSCLFIVFPDIDEHDGGPAFICFFEFSHDRGHHFAGDAFVGSQIDHGDHALNRHVTEFFGIGYGGQRAKQNGKA